MATAIRHIVHYTSYYGVILNPKCILQYNLTDSAKHDQRTESSKACFADNARYNDEGKFSFPALLYFIFSK